MPSVAPVSVNAQRYGPTCAPRTCCTVRLARTSSSATRRCWRCWSLLAAFWSTPARRSSGAIVSSVCTYSRATSAVGCGSARSRCSHTTEETAAALIGEAAAEGEGGDCSRTGVACARDAEAAEATSPSPDTDAGDSDASEAETEEEVEDRGMASVHVNVARPHSLAYTAAGSRTKYGPMPSPPDSGAASGAHTITVPDHYEYKQYLEKYSKSAATVSNFDFFDGR